MVVGRQDGNDVAGLRLSLSVWRLRLQAKAASRGVRVLMKDGTAANMGKTSDVELIVRFANGGRLTAGDLALIEAIRKQRSILAASRVTGVSYRKCWLMVDALNRTFETVVVATHPGRRGGGAELTTFGERVVALYKSMERRTTRATAQAVMELTASLDPAYQARASAEVSERQEPQSQSSR